MLIYPYLCYIVSVIDVIHQSPTIEDVLDLCATLNNKKISLTSFSQYNLITVSCEYGSLHYYYHVNIGFI